MGEGLRVVLLVLFVCGRSFPFVSRLFWGGSGMDIVRRVQLDDAFQLAEEWGTDGRTIALSSCHTEHCFFRVLRSDLTNVYTQARSSRMGCNHERAIAGQGDVRNGWWTTCGCI